MPLPFVQLLPIPVILTGSGGLGPQGPAGPAGVGGLIGTLAARPPQPQPAGVVYVTTDGPINFVSNGTIWLPYFNDVEYIGTPVPVAAGFTEIAAPTTTTLVDDRGTLLLTVSGLNADIWQNNTVLTATYTLDFAFSALWAHDAGGADQPVIGMALRDSTSGHFYRIAMYYDRASGFFMQVQRFTAIGTASSVISSIQNLGIMHTAGPFRFRVTFSAGTYSLYTTQDGGTFGSPQTTWTTEAFAAPDHWGIYLNGGNSAPVAIPVRLLSFNIGP
jgi:hypothetical protein